MNLFHCKAVYRLCVYALRWSFIHIYLCFFVFFFLVLIPSILVFHLSISQFIWIRIFLIAWKNDIQEKNQREKWLYNEIIIVIIIIIEKSALKEKNIERYNNYNFLYKFYRILAFQCYKLSILTTFKKNFPTISFHCFFSYIFFHYFLRTSVLVKAQNYVYSTSCLNMQR